MKGRFARRTRVIRGMVTEPEPGRLLVESYPAERMVTWLLVVSEPGSDPSTVMPRRWGLVGVRCIV